MNDRMSRDIAESAEASDAPLANGSAFDVRVARFLSVSARALGVPYDGVQRVLINTMRQRMLRRASGSTWATRPVREG